MGGKLLSVGEQSHDGCVKRSEKWLFHVTIPREELHGPASTPVRIDAADSFWFTATPEELLTNRVVREILASGKGIRATVTEAHKPAKAADIVDTYHRHSNSRKEAWFELGENAALGIFGGAMIGMFATLIPIALLKTIGGINIPQGVVEPLFFGGIGACGLLGGIASPILGAYYEQKLPVSGFVKQETASDGTVRLLFVPEKGTEYPHGQPIVVAETKGSLQSCSSAPEELKLAALRPLEQTVAVGAPR